MSKNDIDVKFKPIDIASEAAHQKVELNLIYLFAEFIDNAKASYEELIADGYDDICKINIIFNQESEYIMIEDFARGFDVLDNISKKGRDNVLSNGTNMYNVGMKSALDYFSDYALVFSKKIGNDKAEMGFWIRKIGVNSEKIKIDYLPNKADHGTQILLFKDKQSLNDFLDHNYPDNSYLLNITSEVNNNNEKNMVSDILENMMVTFPALTELIFARYSSLVNKREQIHICFDIVDANGNYGIEKSIKNRSGYPKCLNVIEKNTLYDDASFNFDNYKKKYNEDWNEYVNASNEYKEKFISKLSDKLYTIWRKDLRKFKKLIRFNDQFDKKLEMFDNYFTNGYISMDFGLENEERYIDALDNWKKTSYINKIIVNSIFNFMLNKNTDKPLKMTLSFKNLTVINNEIVFEGGLQHERNIKTFGIKVNIYFEDSKFSNFKYRLLKSDDMSMYNYFFTPESPSKINGRNLLVGFDVIQNDRALRHGPNLDDSQLMSNSPLAKYSIQKKFMSDFLSVKQYEFQIDSKKASLENPFTFTKGGNNSKHSQMIYGDIEIPNNSVFKPGQDKASFDPTLLEKFMRDIFVIFDINAIAILVNALNNNKEELEIYKLINDEVKAEFNKLADEEYIKRSEREQEELKMFEADIKLNDFRKEIIEADSKEIKQNMYNEQFNDMVRTVQKNNALFLKLDNNNKTLRHYFKGTKKTDNGLICSFVIENAFFEKWNNEIIINLNYKTDIANEYVYEDNEPIEINILCNEQNYMQTIKLIIKYVMILINRIEVIMSIKHKDVNETIKDEILEVELVSILNKILEEAV
jgi:hypothetical protein